MIGVNVDSSELESEETVRVRGAREVNREKPGSFGGIASKYYLGYLLLRQVCNRAGC